MRNSTSLLEWQVSLAREESCPVSEIYVKKTVNIDVVSFWSYPSFLYDVGGRVIKVIGLYVNRLRNLRIACAI